MKYLHRFYIVVLLLLLVIYIRGMFVPLMNNDSAHHANIGLHMYLTGDYVSLVDQGKDYLDKPHLLFWLAAWSYHMFGVNTFAYKFFSILFTFLGVFATFRLGRLLYTVRVGMLAALILGSSLAFVLANNDVRMDAILTASVAFSAWQLVEYLKFRKWSNVLWASLGLAIGFSTKGMVGAVVPLLAALGFMLHQRSVDVIHDRKWLVIPLLFFLFVSPVLYSYYLQFDLHPEKIVRGQSGMSGVRFILWSQNFERLDGTNFGGRSAHRDGLFYLHTLLWAFLPWSFLLLAAFWAFLKDQFSHRLRAISRYDGMTLFTVVIMMLLLSFSGYKLPHYLNVIFPFFAVMTAAYLLDERTQRYGVFIFRIQATVVFLLVAVSLMLNGWSLAMDWRILLGFSIVFVVVTVVVVKRLQSFIERAVAVSLTGALFCNALLNFNWYPKLLEYQAGNVLAIASKAYQSQDYVFLKGYERSPSFEFYRGDLMPEVSLDTLTRHNGRFKVYTGEKGLRVLEELGIPFDVVATAPNTSVSGLTLPFLNPETRSRILTHHFLIEVPRRAN